MSWVKDALTLLGRKETAKVRPHVGSMRGRIESGQLVTLDPIHDHQVQVEDVAFIKWKGNYLLHIVKEITDGRVLIGNNIGKINSWASMEDILGIVTKVQD